MKTLFLLRGLPGAGKSTLAQLLAPDYEIFEADKFWYQNSENEYKFDADRLHEAHQWCQNGVEDAMENNKDTWFNLIVSNTLTTEKELKPYYELARKYDYRVISLIVENRHEGKSIHNVPEETLQKMRNRFSIKL